MVERLRSLCKSEKTSFSALEKELGFANGSLAKSDERIQAARLHALATRFGVSMEYILTGDDTKPHETRDAKEQELLRVFRSLNAQGRSEAIRRMTEMSMIPSYGIGQESGKSYPSANAG